MKLKEQKKFGILWLSIGAALFLAGLLLGETEYGSYIGGFGGGLTAVGLVRLLRVRRLSPKFLQITIRCKSLRDIIFRKFIFTKLNLHMTTVCDFLCVFQCF